MKIESPSLPLCCPVCGGLLNAVRAEGRVTGFVCERRHSYDAAKQGYVNLFTANRQKASGDSKEMAAARSKFLEAGYYAPFSDAVNECIADILERREPPYVLADAGCGDGYYTNRLSEFLGEKGLAAVIGGFDLSKHAVIHGAKTARALKLPVQYAVASLFHLPLISGSCDAVANLFAPCAADEFYRVLQPAGFLLLAAAGADHLWELKTSIYKKPYRNIPRRDELSGFELTDVRQVIYRIRLQTSEDIRALYTMTPYYWKTSREDADKLLRLEEMETTVSFDILLYRKLAGC